MLGLGDYYAYISERGGQFILGELAIGSLDFQRVVDNNGSGNITVLPSSIADSYELLRTVQPWEHEILIYRGNELAFVGPVITPEISESTCRIAFSDLFAWMDYRIIEKDLKFWDDDVLAFEGIVEAAMEADPSPNISVITHPSGIKSNRSYKAKDVHRASDLLREIARTAVDFTVIGRTIYVGGPEIEDTIPMEPIILTDEGVAASSVTRDGTKFATDVRTYSGHPVVNGRTQKQTLIGKATLGIGKFGLVQQVFTELLVSNLVEADLNAASRLHAMQPAPLSISVTFSPRADCLFKELIPGRRVDVRLARAGGCIPIDQTMRLSSVSVSYQQGEQVTGTLVPIGLDNFTIPTKSRGRHGA